MSHSLHQARLHDQHPLSRWNQTSPFCRLSTPTLLVHHWVWHFSNGHFYLGLNLPCSCCNLFIIKHGPLIGPPWGSPNLDYSYYSCTYTSSLSITGHVPSPLAILYLGLNLPYSGCKLSITKHEPTLAFCRLPTLTPLDHRWTWATLLSLNSTYASD